MLRFKGFIYLLIFNIFVSATVTLAVLYFWEQARLGTGGKSPTPVVIYIPITGTPPTLPAEVAALLSEVEATPIPASDTPTPFMLRTEVYFVQAGDSLGQIAQRFNVSVADILSVNSLDDPDRLLVGQKILIPVGPLPTQTPFIPTATHTLSPTPTPRLSPTPTRTPTRTPDQSDPQVRIESVLGPGDYAAERVKIIHSGGRDVLLQGWRLLDSDGNQYIFPQLTLRAGSLVYVHTGSGADSVTDLYWGLPAAVWRSGEVVVLQDGSGAEIDRFTIP